MADDLQSFLANFSAQTAKPDESTHESVDGDQPAATALCSPSSNVDLESFGRSKSKQPVCTPITRMASDFDKKSAGRLIAVNDSYICYSIKGNLIRVIHFVQVTRNKLSAHPSTLVDLELNKEDLLASLDINGILRLRRIFEESGECCYSTDLEVRFPSSAQRVCWGPMGSDLIAVACGKNVVVFNFQRALVFATSASEEYPVFDPESLGRVGAVCEGHDGDVQDLCFSPNGGDFLLSASDDGTVRLFSVGGPGEIGMPTTVLSCVSILSPYAGAPVASAVFAGPPIDLGAKTMWSIITGTVLNGAVTFWQAKSPEEDSSEFWIRAHEVTLHSSASSLRTGWTNVAIDASAQFLLLANVQQAAMFVLHLKDEGGGFDFMSKWDIAHPILSFVPVSRLTKSQNDTISMAGEEVELQAFCIQTKAIQKYSIRPKECKFDPMSSSITVPGESGTAKVGEPSPQAVASLPSVPLNSPGAALSSTPAPAVPPLPNSPAVSATELHKMEARLLTAMSRTLEEKLTEANRIAVRDSEAKLSRLVEALTKEVATALSSAVESKMKKSFSELETKMKQVARDGNQAQANSLRTLIHGDLIRLKEDVVTAVARDVDDPILAAFKSCFQDLLIPSLQSATQRMFRQIDDSLATRFESLPEPVASSSSGRVQLPTAPKEPKEEIAGLLDAKKYDEALMKALGAQDLTLLSWLCKKVDPGIMHESSGVLSQTVLICLLQQLGADLMTDTSVKLNWLKEIALNLDKDEPAIATYAPSVVKQLKESMRDFQGTEAGRQVRTELSLILRVL